MKKYLLLIVITGFATGAYAECPAGEVLGINSGECIPASGTWDNGTKGSGTWTMTADGTLTVSGTGALKDVGLNGDSAPWTKADIKNFVVADGIEAIGSLGLSWIGKVNIQLANSVKKIGGYTFYNANTDNIILPNELEEIGGVALHCHSAARVVIPESVEKLNSSDWGSGKKMTMYCPPKWLDKCKGNNVTSFAYEKVGDEYLVYNKDGSIKASFKNYDDLAKDNLLANYQKNADGSYTLTDANGQFIEYKGKKIYTVEEAMEVTKNGDRFHVSLTYK